MPAPSPIADAVTLTNPGTAPDVLVVGAGIAGLTAAVEAADAGADVAVASLGPLCSGSSFFPGTWGLGLIAPAGPDDAEDLAETIVRVGCGMADRRMVDAFVADLLPAVDWLENRMGIELRRPSGDAAGQRAFIPCFDHAHRTWRGIEREQTVRAFGSRCRELGVRRFDRLELVDLMRDGAGAVCGAVLFDGRRGELLRVPAGAVVLACGGTSGLFERKLTSADVVGSAQGIAMAHGAALVNIEFMQMMPGLVAPRSGLVFNEKTFRFTVPERPLAQDAGLQRRLLEMRSGYGPFTARLESRAVDIAIAHAGDGGWRMRYDLPDDELPEFIEVFCDWLEREHGIGRDEGLSLAPYAHASNGGVLIGPDGSCGIPGLFACGEVAGGMHGADRIGGLSSANGVVFGRRAGAAAARTALRGRPSDAAAGDEGLAAAAPEGGSRAGVGERFARGAERRIRATMSAHAMIERDGEGLRQAARDLESIEADRVRTAGAGPAADADRARNMRLAGQLVLARAMVAAMDARAESRGAHYRTDSPQELPEFDHPIAVRLAPDGSIRVSAVS